MPARFWFASSLVACAIVTFLNPQIRAADESAASTPSSAFTGLIPDDAFAALVLYPNRVLANESLAKFDVKGMADDFAKLSGVSPMEVEQAIFLVGPAQGAEKPPGGAGAEPTWADIFRLSKLTDHAEFAAKMLKPSRPEEAEVAGHKYFRAAKNQNDALRDETEDVAICFIDDRTMIVANPSWLPNIFDSKDAKSVLIAALAANDPAADATIVFANTDAAKGLITSAIHAKGLAGPLQPFGELPELLRAAKLSVRTNPELSLKLTLLAKDEDSAGKLAGMIKMGQQMGQAFLPALQVPPGTEIPAERRESQALMAALATKLVNGLVPVQSGPKVTVEIGSLGTVDALVGKLLLPAIIAARAAAKRIQGMNNLKQLALAMFNSESVDGHFPANAIYSKAGKPLLSWRVYVLPYLEQKPLFDQFHLDEPWDSANNKPLIAKMPAIYKSPNGAPLAAGQTRYVVPVGKDTIFDGDKGTKIQDITDGTSNTIMILEVGEDKAVTWTKPDDMDFDPQKPLAGLGTIGEQGISAAFADGHVQNIRNSIEAETFRRLILRNDGQTIDMSKF